jgi:NitT/TauT family transport system substrate-binding protein
VRAYKIRVIFLTFVLGLVSIVSCKNAAQQPTATTKIRIGTFSKGLQAPMYHIVKKHKFLEAHGIEPVFTEFGLLPAETQAFASGELDIAWFGLTQAANLRNKGVPLKIVLAHANSAERVLVKSDSSIKSLSELEGKKVGTPGEGTTAYTFFRIIAKDVHKIDLNKITFVKASEDNLARFVSQGEIDAAVLKIETFAIMEDFPMRQIASLADDWEKIAGEDNRFVQVASNVQETFIKENPDAVKRYILAMKEANEYASTHKEELTQLLAEQFSMTADAAQKYLAEWDKIYFCNLSDSTQQAMRKQWEAMVAIGDLSGTPDDIFAIFPEAQSTKTKSLTQIQQ